MYIFFNGKFNTSEYDKSRVILPKNMTYFNIVHIF